MRAGDVGQWTRFSFEFCGRWELLRGVGDGLLHVMFLQEVVFWNLVFICRVFCRKDDSCR